ncbi:MAG: hypothetical protein M1828_005840 [Chrysothrix sp. TS-e1954]|nr:MAG: hypothetical protein M1828_005840 [Chrysothrix sp. TS-e1954]
MVRDSRMGSAPAAPFRRVSASSLRISSSSHSSGQVPSPPKFSPDPVAASQSLTPDRDEKRILELHLLHHWTEHTSKTFLSQYSIPTWQSRAPLLALQFPYLLDAILAFAALHLARLHPDNMQYEIAHTEYFSRAIEGQRLAVESIDATSADAVYATLTLICDYAFFSLRHPGTPLEPALPLAWLRCRRGSRIVFCQCYPWIATGMLSEHRKDIPIDLTRDSLLFTRENNEPFDQHARWEEDESTLSAEDREIYEKALSYLGSIHFAMVQNEKPLTTCRRILNFPARLPARMIELIEELYPRALAILAHLFSLLDRLRPDSWWFEGVAQSQIMAILHFLPEDWHDFVYLPLQPIRGTTIID